MGAATRPGTRVLELGCKGEERLLVTESAGEVRDLHEPGEPEHLDDGLLDHARDLEWRLESRFSAITRSKRPFRTSLDENRGITPGPGGFLV
jgi:hypothetical protein